MNLHRFITVLIWLTIAHSLLDAQFYYFGRNKVQYTEFDWHVLKTDHFDIYYYTEMKELAERGAAFAEETYKELEERFNFTVRTSCSARVLQLTASFSTNQYYSRIHPRRGWWFFRIY